MTDPGCQSVRETAAVALLRREPLPAAIREHHDSCPPCRVEFERLMVLPPLLAAARDADVPPVEVPDQALLRRLLAEVSARRRRRRLLVVAAAAAAAVVLAVPIGAWLADRIGPSDGGARPAPTRTTGPDVEGTLIAAGTGQDAGSSAGASVQVLAHGAGRGSTVVVAPWGLTGGTLCRIDVIDSAGSARTLQAWTVPAGYRRGWQSRTTVSIAPREITGVRLVDGATGHVLLTVPVQAV
jgi:hypothetical protein